MKKVCRTPLAQAAFVLSLLLATFSAIAQNAPKQELWKLDRLDTIGGHPSSVEGRPRLIETPYGKAIAFNGADDALFVESHPLAGAAAFTWEMIFRPDADGAKEQRIFHLQEKDPATGADTSNRMLFELRIVDGKWCLDSFVSSSAEKKAIIDWTKLHSLGEWHHVATVYDGEKLSNYVDGVLQSVVPFKFETQRPGHASIGVRINRRDYFKGAILLSRTTPKALTPNQFLNLETLKPTNQ